MSADDIERLPIDPEKRFPSEGFRRCEANGLRLLNLIPGTWLAGRTRDCLQIELPTGAGPDEDIAILVTAESFDVRAPTLEWTCGAYGAARASSHRKRLRSTASDEDLASAIERVRQRRLAEFSTCLHCGCRLPPECRHSKSMCQNCASQHLGIVY